MHVSAGQRLVTILCLVVFSIAGVWYAFIARPAIAKGRQKRNVANFQVLQHYLNTYRDSNGSYPAQLSDAVPEGNIPPTDSWGYPTLYLSDGHTFLLVSFGRDGLADGINYHAYSFDELEKDCHEPSSDQVLGNEGWLRACSSH